MKKTAPTSEAVLSKHIDIIYRCFNEVKTAITFDEVYQLLDWLVDHKREYGRRFYVIRNWAERDLLDICEFPKTERPKTYTCRYCGNKTRDFIVADNTFICRGCAGL